MESMYVSFERHISRRGFRKRISVAAYVRSRRVASLRKILARDTYSSHKGISSARD